ncbi:MAG: hypothetical protein JW928_03530, partial [Candidatus Aureabacteria bacterium]|nr:hypothetical protein [Candidatus Auribacterota bacterium]
MKIFRFRYVYLFSFIFWISMTAWFSFILLKKERGIAYQSQFTPTGDRFLFQEKKFVIAQRDSIFGVMTSFFSLSDSISFEWDLSINYLYNSQEISQKVYGKIEADRLRNIRDINVILKSTKDNSEDVSLTSFRGMFRNNALFYDIIIKKDENRQMSGDIPVKGEYWLINPVYPFGRNMRYIREDKKRTTFYNPWS